MSHRAVFEKNMFKECMGLQKCIFSQLPSIDKFKGLLKKKKGPFFNKYFTQIEEKVKQFNMSHKTP